MEKPATTPRSKNKLLKFLPRAAVSFSPADHRPDGKLKKRFQRAFSGPIAYMIPAEARSRSRNFENTREPTSPKVSCMGQVKCKKMAKKKKAVLVPKDSRMAVSTPQPEKDTKNRPTGPITPAGPGPEMKKKHFRIKKIFGGRTNSEASIDHVNKLAEGVPSLSQMRRFASTRDTFADFDWTTADIATKEDKYLDSDEEGGFSEKEDDFDIPFSTTIMAPGPGSWAGLAFEPRKEVNLWQRRTMAQPKPLKVSLVGALHNN